MFAFLLINIWSADISIEGCTYQNSFTVGMGSHLTRTVSKGTVLCIEGSVLIKSDNPFVATYKIIEKDRQGTKIIIKTGTKENPFLFGAKMKENEMKIEAMDPSQDLKLEIVGIRTSDPNLLRSYSIFTTMKSFNKVIEITPKRALDVFTWNQYPLNFSVNPRMVYKEFSNLTSFSQSFSQPTSFKYWLGLTTRFEPIAEKVNVVWEEDTTEQPISGFKNPFGEDVLYFLPNEDAFTLEEVIK
ncbi:hypothetical protein TVAG_374670 [Trichomonas vaginalis G3]|uniref:Uncharacterized protein n=1 Tax=Trichomonas vaginalis (strain ATCC PRA-98 / G3) TaxID=412133 RepID=A2FCI0_TRIV3|nr:hypothetical protein TVAGG3_0151520 [Trichomonas vaginalis G3]EAX97386.1 hypothetical protein TVAG_374670 [Trichomonas vaginalis G3]KAI5547299.1 hypothetical protein TVAGG3_0151520 [Trichomonas vaginalis G3]|eukprot:XP_001310316.1 hypothetical protein [Trichomonas vaginalis G3]